MFADRGGSIVADMRRSGTLKASCTQHGVYEMGKFYMEISHLDSLISIFFK